MNNLNVAKIQLNGSPYEISSETNLNQLLNELKIKKNKVAIEVNGEIVKNNINEVEAQLVKDIMQLIGLIETFPGLTDHMKQRIIFALTYFCDENDEIPDFIPDIGYLDDASVAQWIVNGILLELPPPTKA